MNKLITALVLIGFSGCTHAKEGLSESPALGAFSLAPMFEATLSEYTLDIKLEYERYHAEQNYLLNVGGRQSDKARGFIFPMLCLQQENCIEQFAVEINGIALEAQQIEIDDISDVAYLLDDSAYLFEALDLASEAYSAYGISHRVLLSDFRLRLYRFYIPAEVSAENENPLKLRILYTAPYYFYLSGKKESAFYAYSNDILFFSFSPAARWAGGKLDHFKLSFDASHIFGSLNIASGLKMDVDKQIYRYERKKADLSKIEPLVLVFDRRKEKQYKRYVNNRNLVQQDVRIEIEGAGNEVSALLNDQNLMSAWCSNARTARIKMTLAKPEAASLCEFDGFALVNGNTASAEALQLNGRIKSAIMRLQGVERFSQDHKRSSWEYKTTVQDVKPGVFWNPYEALRYFTRKNRNENFNKDLANVLGVEGKEIDLDVNDVIEMELQVLDIYEGKTENLCIAELIPLFNCY